MVIKRILLFNLGYVFQNKGGFMGCHRYVSFYFLFQYTIYNCFALPLLQILEFPQFYPQLRILSALQ